MAAADDPVPDPVHNALEVLCELVRPERGGEVASYIPELSRADPEHLGLALVSLAGHLYTAGDADVPFTVQSISKPFVFALVLAERGLDAALAKVGAEPSGEAFNAISLDEETGRPANPMVNAGALVTTSLVPGADPRSRFGRIRSRLSAFAGRELAVDEAVCRSELETGDRNRALAYLARNAGVLDDPVDEVVDAYVHQCSLLVTARDLAVMAATLANGGLNPVTGEQVVGERVAEQTCAVMTSCGMYDFAGEWMLRVGLPAKSGVSGGLMAVSPGQFGIGLYSPRLDARGNSVRGVAACEVLADRFSLGLIHRPRRTVPVLALDRTHTVRADGLAGPVAVLAVQGDVEFTVAEQVVFATTPLHHRQAPGEAWLVLDLAGVTRIHPVAAELLAAMARQLALHGTTTVLADPGRRHLVDDTAAELPSVDEAVAWCTGRRDAQPSEGPSR
jgi:glutaminase